MSRSPSALSDSDFKEFRLRTKGCSQNRSVGALARQFQAGSSGLRNSTRFQRVELLGERRPHAHIAAFFQVRLLS